MSWTFEDVIPRARVVSDNDYAGDPDGLVQLAQLVLSPSVVVPFVIGSHLPEHGFGNTAGSAARAAVAARQVVELCNRDVPVIAGTERALTSHTEPIESDAARAIVTEAMRADTELPLFVTCGAGLTEIASAWLIEPRIGRRITLVWIGGHEHAGMAEPPPGGDDLEYNTSIDPIAAQVVFNDSDIAIWQVPRDVYRMAIASRAELMVRMLPQGDLGRHLFDALADAYGRVKEFGMQLGEVWVMGDSPLVLLTALWTGFEPGPASSPSVTLPCPRILDSGLYEDRPDGRPLRLFTGVDTRLMLEDLYAKLALHADGQR